MLLLGKYCHLKVDNHEVGDFEYIKNFTDNTHTISKPRHPIFTPSINIPPSARHNTRDHTLIPSIIFEYFSLSGAKKISLVVVVWPTDSS